MDRQTKREGTLDERYRSVRAQTVALAAPLSPEDMQVQSMPDVSPTKWHLAHTTWFFETFVLARHDAAYRPFDPAYALLFNSYYEAVGPRHPRPARGLLTRPGADEVRRYREAIDTRMLELLQRPLDDDTRAVVTLGLHHEQQHQELVLTDVQHVLSINPLRPAYRAARGTGERAVPPKADGGGFVAHRGGDVEIGHAGDAFAFDNETPRHVVHLEPFEIARRPVTCGEYLAFIEDGGYERPDLWLSDGWAAVQANGWRAPMYWDRSEREGFLAFTLEGLRPLELDAPVSHVSQFEADAYAHWANARLPTEAEWEVFAREHAVGDAGANLLEAGRLRPVPPVDSATHPFGDVWQWTASPYVAYPRYRPLPGALGEYNGKFMSGQMVLRGGSCFTPRSHVRATYRNFFPPPTRWQMAGFRLARWP
jgi:ergothioneine biosynthesis protein EgtB